jgi:hypothetical protein
MLAPQTLLRLLAILSALGLVATSLPPAVCQTPTTVSAPLFGMTIVTTNDWPTVSVGALGKGAAVNWPYTEPQRGVYNWSNLDAWVNLADSHGVSFFFSNDLVPEWAAADTSTCSTTFTGSSVVGCTSGVANIQDWDNFVTALATRYKGRIIYELWNEPNAKTYTGTLAEMVTLTSHEYNIIRRLDPGALIATPGPTYGVSGAADYLTQYFNAGGPTGIDVVSWHAYWPDPEHVVSNVAKMRTMMNQFGLSSKQLWDTEGAWNNTQSLQQQAAFVARYYLLHGSLGLNRFYWYAWDSPSTGTMFIPGSGERPDAIAYQQVYNWMVGATITGPCSVASDSTWTCTLTRPNGYEALAVWNSSGTVSYTPNSIYKSYKDLSGNTHTIQGSIQVSTSPILMESHSGPVPPTNLSVVAR